MWNEVMPDLRGYSAEEEVPERRPWDLLYVGDVAGDDLPDIGKELTHILELLPTVSILSIKLKDGKSFQVSRDYPSNYVQDVDELLFRILSHHPQIAGVTFPAQGDVPEHTATLEEPFAHAQGKPTYEIFRRLKLGEITTEEASKALDAIYKDSTRQSEDDKRSSGRTS
jgi:hypothetical protein